MNPDTPSRGDTPVIPPRDNVPVPLRPASPEQTAAVNVIRTQIDALYGDSPVAVPAGQTAPTVAPDTTGPQPADDTNPYHRTHSAHPAPQAEQWKQYHTAWQQYYQKYYEGYYSQQIAQQQAQAQTDPGHAAKDTGYFTQQPAPETQQAGEELSSDEALLELRQKLLGRVQASAQKIRRSRHFVPIAAALGVMVIFVFLQYNRVFVASVRAYVSPGSIDPQNIVVDPTADVVVGSDPRLIIPKINVDVPVVYDIGNDKDSQMTAMEKGVAHFAIPGASSHPGEIGNTAIAGHSSNDLFDTGDYKFIFAQLEKLAVGDSIYANYQGKRYTYVVTKTEVVHPTQINKLVYPTDKPMLTLITCTPLGTAIDRLLVTAEQVSPDPAQAAAAPVPSADTNMTSIPGDSPTLLERLFGA